MLLVKIGDLIHAIALVIVIARTLMSLVHALHLGLGLGLVVDHWGLG